MGNEVDVVLLVTEGVDGRDCVSGNDKEVSEQTSIGSLTRFVSP